MTGLKIEALDHLVLTVADIAASKAFYSAILGMKAEVFQGADGTERHTLRFGYQKINLHEVGREFAPHAKRPCAGSADLCFLTNVDVRQATRKLAAQGIVIEDGPIKRSGACGPILSIYFRDPDGNLLEVAQQL